MTLPPQKGTNEVADFIEVSLRGGLKCAGSEDSKNSEIKFLRFLGDFFFVCIDLASAYMAFSEFTKRKYCTVPSNLIGVHFI